jgi:hypothetical protein
MTTPQPRVTDYSITASAASGAQVSVMHVTPGAGPPELHLAAALAATQVLWDGDWQGSPDTPTRILVTETMDLGRTSRIVFEDDRPPELISITPDTGPQAGGTFVTLTGRNFPPQVFALLIRFEISPAVNGYASAVVVDSETITCVTPPMGAAGLATVHLHLDAPGGGTLAILPDAFTFAT